MEKKVLLFSGGFDSRLQEWLIKPDILLYVDMKTSYSERELEELERLSPYYKDRLIIKELPLGEYERENKYLPYRNLLLGAIAMEYGQHIYFGFNSTDDDSPDADKDFMRLVSSLFEHLNIHAVADMGWENANFSFNAPFISLDKTEMVHLALKNGMSPTEIQHIRSCYSGTSQKGCGVCKTCFKKAVALINNGLYEPSLFDRPIMKEDFENTLNRLIRDYGEDCKYTKEVKKAQRIFLRQERK